jgi:hypothetical protein
MDGNGNIVLPKWVKKIRNKKIDPSPAGARRSDAEFIWRIQIFTCVFWLLLMGFICLANYLEHLHASRNRISMFDNVKD